MRNTLRIIIQILFSWFPRSLFIKSSLPEKPDVIERSNGVVQSVFKFEGKTKLDKACEGAKEAEVKLNNGKVVYAFIPPQVVVNDGDHITIALLANKGSSFRFYVYSQHLTSRSSQGRRISGAP